MWNVTVVGWYRAAVAWGGSESMRFHTQPRLHSDHDLLPPYHTHTHTHLCITTPLATKMLTQAKTHTHIRTHTISAFRRMHRNTNGWNRKWHQRITRYAQMWAVTCGHYVYCNKTQSECVCIHVWANFSLWYKLGCNFFFSLAKQPKHNILMTAL